MARMSYVSRFHRFATICHCRGRVRFSLRGVSSRPCRPWPVPAPGGRCLSSAHLRRRLRRSSGWWYPLGRAGGLHLGRKQHGASSQDAIRVCGSSAPVEHCVRPKRDRGRRERLVGRGDARRHRRSIQRRSDRKGQDRPSPTVDGAIASPTSDRAPTRHLHAAGVQDL